MRIVIINKRLIVSKLNRLSEQPPFLTGLLIGSILYYLIIVFLSNFRNIENNDSFDQIISNWYDEQAIYFTTKVNQNKIQEKLNAKTIDFKRPKFYTNELNCKRPILLIQQNYSSFEKSKNEKIFYDFMFKNLNPIYMQIQQNTKDEQDIIFERDSVFLGRTKWNKQHSSFHRAQLIISFLINFKENHSSFSILNEYQYLLIIFKNFMINPLLLDNLIFNITENFLKSKNPFIFMFNKDKTVLLLSSNLEKLSQTLLPNEEWNYLDNLNHIFYLPNGVRDRWRIHLTMAKKEFEIVSQRLKHITKLLNLIQPKKKSDLFDKRMKHPISSRFDLVTFQRRNHSLLYQPDDFHNFKYDSDLTNRKVQLACDELFNCERKKHLSTLSRLYLDTGEQYLLDYALVDQTQQGVIIRCEAIRALLPVQLVQPPVTINSTNSLRIIFIIRVRILAEAIHLTQHIRTFVQQCAKAQKFQPLRRYSLVIIFQYNKSQEDVYHAYKVFALRMQARHRTNGADIRFLNVRTSYTLGQLVALRLLVKAFPDLTNESIITLLSPAAVINEHTILRISEIIGKGERIYSMIPFFEYQLAAKIGFKPEVHKRLGHFAHWDWEHISFSSSIMHELINSLPSIQISQDVLNSATFEISCFQSSDCGSHLHLYINLFEKKKQKVHFLRSPEPELLVHYTFYSNCLIFDGVSQLEKKSCEMYSQRSLGTKSQLAALLVGDTKREHD